MRGRPGRGGALLGAVTATVALTAGCSLVGEECSGFALDFAADSHGQASPAAAAEAFSHQGTASVPGSGWHQVSSDEGGVRLRSGKATVHVTRFSDGTWAVDSGTTC